MGAMRDVLQQILETLTGAIAEEDEEDDKEVLGCGFIWWWYAMNRMGPAWLVPSAPPRGTSSFRGTVAPLKHFSITIHHDLDALYSI